MADLDTREKRASGIGVSFPWRWFLPLPDGTVAQADRQQVASLYAGIAAGAAAPTRKIKARLTPRVSYPHVPRRAYSHTPRVSYPLVPYEE